MTALLQAPETDGEPDANAIDHKLVAAVRTGDDRAFEGLYERYQRRIHAYVLGMVKDHQRAEDVTQEVFVSALRRMRATERPIAFKPWIYEIAKNACIDQFRRSRRAEEVSFDADDGLAPSDYGRLVSPEPIPDAALLAKQSLNDLCGAFGGLSDAHHEILVLRELEGLSYREIGERMGMSRPAVESTLFRARRRLTEEYDELASGERCVRIQSIIATAGSGRLGARDTRKLARHVAHCQPCRREAVAAGVDAALLARRPLRERAAAKVAALFPFPLLLRFRRGGGGGSRGDQTGASWVHQLPAISEQASAGGAKVAAAAALLVAGLGVGGQHVVPSEPPRGDAPRCASDRAGEGARRRRARSPAPRGRRPRSPRAPVAARRRPRRRAPRSASAPVPSAAPARARARPSSRETADAPAAGSAPASGGGGSGQSGGAERTVQDSTGGPHREGPRRRRPAHGHAARLRRGGRSGRHGERDRRRGPGHHRPGHRHRRRGDLGRDRPGHRAGRRGRRLAARTALVS